MVDETAGGPNVTICWELGGGLGHIVKGALLGRYLLERDCTVSFAVRELGAAHQLLPEDYYCVVQAPVVGAQLKDWPPPADYGEMLLHVGWGQTRELQGRVRGWRGLFDSLGTDLVIADHAPTAVLAARTSGIPAVLWGHGFFAPPVPWPVFRDWERAPQDRLHQARQHVLQVVNQVLNSFGRAPIGRLEEVLESAESFLCTWPELDHYARSGQPNYVGPMWLDESGIKPDWGTGLGLRPKVFAYLRPNLPGVSEVLSALAELEADVLVYMTENTPWRLRFTHCENLRFTDQILRMKDVAEVAHLVICSGSDTLCGMVLSGVPVLGLPMNAEQRIAATRIEAQGAGRCVVPEEGDGALADSVRQAAQDIIGGLGYRQAAQKLKSRYGGFDRDGALRQVADRCVALATAGKQ